MSIKVSIALYGGVLTDDYKDAVNVAEKFMVE